VDRPRQEQLLAHQGDQRTLQRRLHDALPALFAVGESPGEEDLTAWLPDVWQGRQRRVTEAVLPPQG
jgi:hypothetical protein